MFVSDLDDTLVYNVKEVHAHDKRALQWLADQGTEICFSSGRFAHRIHEAVRQFGISYHTASLNGAYVTTSDGTVIHERVFSGSAARDVYRYLHPQQLAEVVCAKAERYTRRKREVHKQFEEHIQGEVIELETLEEEFGKSIHPSKFFLYGEEREVQRLDEELRDVFAGQAEVVISGRQYVDLMPAGVSKGEALRVLMEHLGLKPGEVACIGDSFNDVSMFAVTPHSFALQHANQSVKERAMHVVRSVEEAVMKLSLLA
nr:Cof-type HAD-IIB family hydrolase [Ectobacillus ponti]